MNPSCPDCNTELTPSIVGYLCHDCGTTHSFEKMANVKQSSGKQPAKPIAQKKPSNQKSSQNSNKSATRQPPTKVAHIKNKVKNFILPVVAELPKPIDESHLINDHYPSDTSATQVPLGAPTTIAAPPLAAAIQQNEIASEQQNESFAQYMHQQDIESGQLATSTTLSSSSRKNVAPIIVAILVITAGITLVLALAYRL